MAKTHTGALSGVTYTIPELADTRNIETAFTGFADTLPEAPPRVGVQAITTATAAAANVLYTYAGSVGVTVTLPAAADYNGDKVLIYQLGTGVVTFSGIGVGTPVTAGQFTAVTAVWDGAKWVGTPFSFSGTPPTVSSGGEITDLNGFRYHAFKTPGTYTFISHGTLAIEALIVGAAGGGETSAVGTAGPAGQGGTVLVGETVTVPDWTFTPVIVGAGGAQASAGAASSFGEDSAAGGAGGHAGTSTPSSTAATITGDWATVLGKTSVGGPGGSGPAAPATYGVGGGGGYSLLASYGQGSYTYSWTTGGAYSYDCSYGARAVTTQTGSSVVTGDAQPAYCPSGWHVVGVTNGGVQCQNYTNPTQVAWNGWFGGCPGGWYGCGMSCCYNQPTYSTSYYCDSGGSLSGTTCVKTCTGDNTVSHSELRWSDCAGGYTAINHVCTDSRATGGGTGGGGVVVVRYAYP